MIAVTLIGVLHGGRGENCNCQVWVLFVTSICILRCDRGKNYFVTSSIGILLVGRKMKNMVVTLIGILHGVRGEKCNCLGQCLLLSLVSFVVGRGKNGDCLGWCLLLPLVSSSIILFIDQREKNDCHLLVSFWWERRCRTCLLLLLLSFMVEGEKTVTIRSSFVCYFYFYPL